MSRTRRALAWTGGLVVALVASALVFDSNWLKGPVEHLVSQRTGRSFAIDGDFDIDLALAPRFRMNGVRLDNPPWASEPETLRLEQAYFSVALLPLLRGEVVLPEVELSRPVIALERARDGADNWTLAAEPAEPASERKAGAPPAIGRLTVDQGLLMFRDDQRAVSVKVHVQTVADAGDGRPGLHFQATGLHDGSPIEAEGRGGLILSLADAGLPYPFSVRFRVGSTRGSLDGSVTGLTALAAAELDVDLAGDSTADLFKLIRLAIPPSPPYRVRGRLIRDGATWRFHDFEGHLGDSDLSGDLDVEYEGQRSRVKAELVSQVLDLDDLGGYVGATPQVGKGEAASERQRREAARQDARPTLLPDTPIKLDRLRAMDADVRFTGRSIRGKTPVDNLETHLVLKHGVLTLRPMNFGVAGGNVVATLTLDGRSERPGIDGQVEFRRIALQRFFPGNDRVRRSTGLIGGRAVLKASGNSLADMLAHADGGLGLAMSGGSISNMMLELAGLDMAEALRLLFRGDRPVPIRCAVADLDVRQGVIRSKSTVIDTADTNLKIDGDIDLRREQLNLTLHPLPKDYSLLSLRSPIHVRGTFKDPAIRPDSALIVRGGVAAILGTIVAPLAALVGLIETGPGDDVDCERLVAAVQRHVPAARVRMD